MTWSWSVFIVAFIGCLVAMILNRIGTVLISNLVRNRRDAQKWRDDHNSWKNNIDYTRPYSSYCRTTKNNSIENYLHEMRVDLNEIRAYCGEISNILYSKEAE